LLGWLKKGRTGHPTGRWYQFHREVEAARLGSPELVALKAAYDRWSADPSLAWKFLERTDPSFARRPDPGPIEVVVTLAPPVDGPTIEGGDPA
jgi:hypothetical protein